jgi:hypothetical protein
VGDEGERGSRRFPVRDPNGRGRRGCGARRRLAAATAGRREGERRVAWVGPTYEGERGGVRGARLGP